MTNTIVEGALGSVFAIRHVASGLYLPNVRSHFCEDCEYVPFAQARLTADRGIAVRRFAAWLRGPFKRRLEAESDDSYAYYYVRSEPAPTGHPRKKEDFVLDEFLITRAGTLP